MQYETISKFSKIFNDIENNKTFNYYFISNNINETYTIATLIADKLGNHDIISLNGELGSGKTAFMQGVAKYFNIEEQVSSPTFTIVNEYITKNNLNIYHFDVYRLKDGTEFLEQIGTDYFSNGISFIEWGNVIDDILPNKTIHIDISKDNSDENVRYFHIWRERK